MKASTPQLHNIFQGFEQARVWVIGDIMLDRYIWGSVDRISPEAPVPVVDVSKEEERLGGAANVALNVHALGAKVTLAGLVGNDAAGKRLQEVLLENGLATTGLYETHTRPTTTKTRILARNQQMLRIDHEHRQSLSKQEEQQFLKQLHEQLAADPPDLIILQDYNKGLLSPTLIQDVLQLASKEGILTAVDPKKENFLAYKGATLFKPNLKELAEGLHVQISADEPGSLEKAIMELRKQMPHQVTLLTLSSRGVWITDGNGPHLVPAHVRDVADVSGAGDTVLSVAALALAQNLDLTLMAELANIAGGMVCEEVGVVPIERSRFLGEATRLLC